MKNKSCFMALVLALLLPAGHIHSASPERAALSGFSSPTGLISDKDGGFLVSEWGRGRIAKIKDGAISIVLDNLPNPAGLAFDAEGNLYIAGYGDGNIYKWDGKNRPLILASGFSSPTGLLWDKDSTLLVANRNAGEVVRVDPRGNRETVSRGHKFPVGLARTEDGKLYISCYGGSVDILDSAGRLSSIKMGLSTPGVGIVPAGKDSVYVVDYGAGKIAEVGPEGLRRTLAARIENPVALAVTPQGNLLVGSWGDNSIHMIDQQ